MAIMASVQSAGEIPIRLWVSISSYILEKYPGRLMVSRKAPINSPRMASSHKGTTSNAFALSISRLSRQRAQGPIQRPHGVLLQMGLPQGQKPGRPAAGQGVEGHQGRKEHMVMVAG